VTVIRAWLSLELRRRWRSLAVLALLVAVAAGTVLASVAGARRGDSALARLAERTLPATAVVLPNQPGFDWDAVRAMPEVEALGTFLLGAEFPVEGIPNGGIGFPPGDDAGLRTIERPVMLAGRPPDPARADEALVTPLFLDAHGLRIGDHVTATLYTPQQISAFGPGQAPGPPAGPRVRIRIVGVGISPWGHDKPGTKGSLQVGAGFTAAYRANFFHEKIGYANAMVRLRGGEAALPAFQQRLATVTGRQDIDVWNRPAQMRQEQRSFAFQARSLLAFAGAALIAAVFLVGQAVARYTASTVADLQMVRALGMTPRQAVLAAAAGPVLAALAGTAIGVGAAGAASRWFPIGSAAMVEPSPGFDLDLLVLGAGLVAVPVLVVAGSVVTAVLASGSQQAPVSRRRSAVATLAARAGLSVPVVVGTRFALESGRGRTAVPVRPALLGAVAGVLGVLGAFTFSSGVADAAATPARFGQTWQLGAFLGYNGQDVVPDARSLLAAVARDPDVTAVNDARLSVALAGADDTAVTLFTHDPVGTPFRTVLTAGRMPSSESEVLLAPNAAAAVGAQVGDRVPFAGTTGFSEFTVVGLGFVPGSPHSDYDHGGWLTPGGYRTLFAATHKFHFGLVSLQPGASAAAVQERLQRVAATVPGGGAAQFMVAEPPSPVAQLREVRALPIALGVFLLLLALGAVGHALATAVRRRRVDVAVLRALGMTRWQSRGVVVTQASVLAVFGLIFGVPLGVALGRTVWRVVADYTPLEYAPPLAALALLLIAPGALLVANLLAAWPGHQAARMRIAHVLRTE